MINPTFDKAEEYRSYVAKNYEGLMSSGRVDYSTAMEGQFGQFASRDTNLALSGVAMGRNANTMLAPLMNLANPDVASGPLGVAATIAAPAAGIGAIGYLGASTVLGAAAAAPVAATLGVGALIAGGAMWASGASQDEGNYARGRMGSSDFTDQIGYRLRAGSDVIHKLFRNDATFQGEQDRLQRAIYVEQASQEFTSGNYSMDQILNAQRYGRVTTGGQAQTGPMTFGDQNDLHQ